MWLLIIIWLICAGFTAYIASEKNRSVINWLILGLLFGLFALIAIAAVPKHPEQVFTNGIHSGIGGLRSWVCSKCKQVNGFAINVCSKCGTPR